MRNPRPLLMLLLLAPLTACEGTNDIADAGCVPLTVPAEVVLLREAGLYTTPERKEPFLAAHPRDTRNDSFSRIRQVEVLAAGSRLQITGLTQEWGFDSGKGLISAIGSTASGTRFSFGWGAATTLGRAPWEPESVPKTRTVDCGD